MPLREKDQAWGKKKSTYYNEDEEEEELSSAAEEEVGSDIMSRDTASVIDQFFNCVDQMDGHVCLCRVRLYLCK